jgi:hypothetical protein
MKTLTLGRTDTAAYTFVAVAGLHGLEKTISAPDQKTARREFWESLTDGQRDSTESVELLDVERFNP